jgi:hypothetical protein
LGCFVSLSGLLVGGQSAQAGKPGGPLAAGQQIRVDARPIGEFHKGGDKSKQVGKLIWRGGLVLSSRAREFGGYSGLEISADGQQFLAVSDAGTWLKGRIVTKGHRPVAVRDTEIGPLFARNGKPLIRSRDRDAEAVRLLSGTLVRGRALVAFENNQRIGFFRIARGQLLEPQSYLRPPQRLAANKGLESVAVVKAGRFKGAIVSFAERLQDKAGNRRGWMWVGGRPHSIGLVDIGGFDVTDLACLEDGRLIVLERRFRWSEGVKMRLRLIPANRLAPGALLNGITLIRADLRYDIDNMEGLAIHRDDAGRAILTLISDDNFNPLLQRTLLLRFEIPRKLDRPQAHFGSSTRGRTVN